MPISHISFGNGYSGCVCGHEEFGPDAAYAELTETEECDRIGAHETQTETRTN